MLDPCGKHGVQRLEPACEVHAGHPVEQVGVDIRKPAGAGGAKCRDRIGAGMQSLQKAQRIRLEALNTDAQPVDTRLEPAIDLLARHIARIGLERDLRAGRQADPPHPIQQLVQLGARQQAWRAAPDEHGVERADGELGAGQLNLPRQCLDVWRDEPFEHGVGVEIAVLTDPGAEGHVQVQAVNPFHQSRLSTAMKASCGISTLPTRFRRFFPSFCFSSSFRFRVTSPP